MDTSKRYSKNGRWLLFSGVAFPIHVWALILIFRDFSWVAERTNSWDAIGVGSYGLMIAAIESVVVFLILLLLGLLVSKKWDEKQRISLLGFIILMVSVWMILGQLFYLTEYSLPENIQILLAQLPPLQFLVVRSEKVI